MDLVRHCLDKQLEDRHGRPMGRVDGILIELRPSARPQVVAVQTGVRTQWDRLTNGWARFLRSLLRQVGILARDEYRIPWSKCIVSGNTVIAGVNAEDTPAFAGEKWLRKHVVTKIPGA